VIKAKKSLGQNFLVDARVARRIIDAVSPQPTDIVLEIGPGTGALTRGLVERSGFVAAVEIDHDLIEGLRRSIASPRLSLVEADALKLDWGATIDAAIDSWRKLDRGTQSEPRVRIVANLPYYISTAVIAKLLRLGRRVFDMTLMLQDEVVDRITSAPGGREYGYLSVLVQYHTVAAKLFEVPPSAFKPAPKVRSAVIRLAVRAAPPIDLSDEDRFFELVKACFSQRRKTLLNNLKARARGMGLVDDVERALADAGIDPKRRAETLSLQEFGALFHALYGRAAREPVGKTGSL